MARVKRGTIKNKRRKNILSQTKGYRFGRKSKERVAHEAIHHAGASAFRDRKRKKQDFRALFTLRVNAAARENGVSYSKLMGALKKSKVMLDRKSLSSLAMNHPEVFARVLQQLSR